MAPHAFSNGFAASPKERRWLFLAQAFTASLSALGFIYVLGRHPWVRAQHPWVSSHFAAMAVLMAVATMGVARGWQAWEMARLRRRASLSEAAVGASTWRRALWAALILQYAGGGAALAAVSLGVPPELVFTGFLFLLVAPALTSSWTARLAERLLARQRDLALQARMAPHFLFNTLSTLKGQIQADPEEAQQTADRLAQLFRDLMDHTAGNVVSLERELTLVEAYLGLEKARLGERLTVSVDVAEGLESMPVPPLCLQVLVENALKHGIAPRKEGGRLSIRAERAPGGLLLSATDPGDGRSSQRGTGQALSILRQRLAKPGDLRLEPLPEGGHRASLLVRA